jgi:DNA-binding NtrC family response regulator
VNAPADAIKPSVTDTVLVIDDEVLIRISIAQYLRDCGYRVLEAANADEAVTILQKPDIQVNVVLCDVEMPGSMNGFGFMKWARELRPGLTVILAGTAERAANAAAELCEDGPMLMKPYDPQIVLDHIKRLLAARARQGGD